MSRITLPLCALCVFCVGGLVTGCGVSQSRYDTLQIRAQQLEGRAQKAEATLARVKPCVRPGVRRCRRPRPQPACRAGSLGRKLRRCQRALRATKRPLVLANHTREQEIPGGRRRSSTVTLLPGTVLMPLARNTRRTRRTERARRTERTLRRALAKRLSKVAACYHRLAKKRRRPPAGQLSFAFEVTRTGRVRRLTVVHRLLRHRATVRCTTRVFRRLRFPRQRRALWAVFPLEFQTGRPYASGAPVPPRRRR